MKSEKEIKSKLNELGADLVKVIPKKVKRTPESDLMMLIAYANALNWVLEGGEPRYSVAELEKIFESKIWFDYWLKTKDIHSLQAFFEILKDQKRVEAILK